MKDIFIDNNIAKNFVNPADPNYKDLIRWLYNFDADLVKEDPSKKSNFAHLVVNNRLLTEYKRSSYNCGRGTAIPLILDKLTKEGRILKVDNSRLRDIENVHLTKAIKRRLRSNIEDHCHICSVIESHRKFVLTIDANFKIDLESFEGLGATVSNRPEAINYDS